MTLRAARSFLQGAGKRFCTKHTIFAAVFSSFTALITSVTVPLADFVPLPAGFFGSGGVSGLGLRGALALACAARFAAIVEGGTCSSSVEAPLTA